MNQVIPAVLAAIALFSVTPSRLANAAEVPPDIADMKVQDLRAGGDAQKRYLVIHRPVEPPADETVSSRFTNRPFSSSE